MVDNTFLLDGLPGELLGSVGYHCSGRFMSNIQAGNSSLFMELGEAYQSSAPPFGGFDVVGVGLKTGGRVFFTLNGR